MNKFFVGVFLCIPTILGSAAVLADDLALRSTLEGRYAAMKTAMAARNGEALSLLLAVDFVSEDVSGQTENASQMIQEVKSLPQDPQKVSQTTLLSVELNGSTAVVDQRCDMKTTKTGADGNKRNIELITISTDTWVNLNGTWVIRRTVTNQMAYFVNGQPVAHKVHAGYSKISY